MVRILHDDWSFRLGENMPDQSCQPIKHLAAMLDNQSSAQWTSPQPLSFSLIIDLCQSHIQSELNMSLFVLVQIMQLITRLRFPMSEFGV